MRLFPWQSRKPAVPVLQAICARCERFNNDPHHIEAEMPGLRSLSSATSAVRSDDGICDLHGRYLGARSTCASFLAR